MQFSGVGKGLESIAAHYLLSESNCEKEQKPLRICQELKATVRKIENHRLKAIVYKNGDAAK